MRSLFIYALTTPVSTVRKNDPVVFNTDARNKVKVCTPPWVVHVVKYMLRPTYCGPRLLRPRPWYDLAWV